MKNTILLLLTMLTISCSSQVDEEIIEMDNEEVAVLGAGCFWCVEAVFTELIGVVSVTSGYTGGDVVNPTYQEVCSGQTGHVEVAKIIFDSTVISYQEILEVFWQTHNPTTLNKQGYDEGTQYRSAIFYTSEHQKEIAVHFKEQLNKSGAWENPIITEINPFGEFYHAEDYHQNYYALNGEKQYCKSVIQPKMEKFRKAFSDKLK